MSDRKHFKLAPSEFAYLFEECPRCYYETRLGLGRRPDTPFPSIFNRIEEAFCTHLDGRSPDQFSPMLPPGRVMCRQRPVTSAAIKVPGHEATVSVGGRMDAWARFSAGGFGVLDFKVIATGDDLALRYARQLWAYAYALEHPAAGTLPLTPVTHLGLFVLEPRTVADMTFQDHNWLMLHMQPHWCPVEPDEGAFLAFLGRVLDVLETPEPPPPDPTCKFCAYRAIGRE
jgi:hypothetical protein